MLPHRMVCLFYKIYQFSVLGLCLFLLPSEVAELIWDFFLLVCVAIGRGFEGALLGMVLFGIIR
jgi:hypothetical protein